MACTRFSFSSDELRVALSYLNGDVILGDTIAHKSSNSKVASLSSPSPKNIIMAENDSEAATTNTAEENDAKASSCGGRKTTLPPWNKPGPATVQFNTGLKVMNSLTRQKEDFVTMSGSRQLTWYMCGPTVYAESHMGHARTYLGFDIIRRILEKHFGYDITLVMNVTDIDDKIVERSAERKMDHLELTRHFEQEFHKDMRNLCVAPPTVVTRVTEYMKEIVDYVQQIIDRGFAYESNGSVYFQVEAFENAPNMHYCKLSPEQIHNAALLAEGEGKLTQEFASEKKSPRDFALWKKAKPGEPVWESPWGPGRPGWHIECSVMASDVLQKLTGQPNMDIHSGGIDLKFPHHDNEMAQAEAHCGHNQWVNYFVHAGHLHIRGLKMSKSLKNFITIQQALEINTARQIRLLFLRHRYNAPMDYGDDTMAPTLDLERKFVEFFHNAKAFLRNRTLKENQFWSEQATGLQKLLAESQIKVDDALKDDFDTPMVLTILSDLVKATNVYMESSAENEKLGLVVMNVATYITRILSLLGLNGLETIGLSSGDDSASGGASREDHLAPVLDALMAFRSAVRDKARNKDLTGILELCDHFRDEALVPLGVRLEDKSDGSVWKLANPADLLREMEQRNSEIERKAEEKAAKEAEAAKKEALNKLSPADYMKQLKLEDGTTPMYTQFDHEGMPTHDSNNEELNKNQKKKAQKLFKTQQGKYEKFLKSEGSNIAPSLGDVGV
ncbi:hypothetical protein ACA910_013454 [Epithemia clementina (nom. ined.)]